MGKLVLRDIPFNRAMTSSGTRGLDGRGYPYHNWPPWRFFLDFSNSTCVFKTITLSPKEGNMPLREDGVTPWDRRPKCIVVKPLHRATLNAVGLSNFGAKYYLEHGIYNAWPEPFFLSFMAIAKTAKERIGELAAFVRLSKKHVKTFASPCGLEINYSCPNVGLHFDELIDEVVLGLDIANELDIPLVPNFNVMLPHDAARTISELTTCDALSVANSVPWGSFPATIPWKKIFGSDKSPLAHYGGGGYSGPILKKLGMDWLFKARFAQIKKPLIYGGGIFCPEDAQEILRVGCPLVQAVKTGTLALHRPWEQQSTIRTINDSFRH